MSQSLKQTSTSRAIWSLRLSGPPSHGFVDQGFVDQGLQAFQTILSRQEIGFTRLADRDGEVARRDSQAAIEGRAKEIARNCNHMVVIGMGGSSLGTRALLSAVPHPPGRGKVSFLDNIDGDRFWNWLRSLHDLGSIHWVLISKSGNTVETLGMADLVDQQLRQSGHRRLSGVSTVISELKNSPLTNWAHRESVPILEIPVDVGGRFSVLSPVGLLPGVYAGLRLDRAIEGASWALASPDLVAQMAAMSLGSFLRDEWVTMLWSYSDGLRDFGGWWQQLWAESLAKKVNRQGGAAPRVSTPIAAVGACDQHSLLQQVMEGAPDKFVWFQRVLGSESGGPLLEKTLFEGQEYMVGKSIADLFRAEADATEQAMSEANVRSATLQTDRLDERSMAALFMLWQMTIAVMGEILDINAFDQPGVELGKVIARKALK